MLRREPRTRRRIASYGFDPTLCGMGGPAFPGVSLLHAGLRVPTLPTGGGGRLPLAQSMLFMLASIRIPAGHKVKVAGIGQLLNIGQNTTASDTGLPVFPLVQPVRSSSWRFSDVPPPVWALRMVRNPPTIPLAIQNPMSTDSFAWRWSDTPALLFETATFPAANLSWNGTPDNYLALTSYTAPYGGLIPGDPVGNLGSFRSLDFPWDRPGKQTMEPVIVEGPGALCLFVQLCQTDPSSRPTLTVPQGFPIAPTGMPEDGALASFTSPGFMYWDVGGWIEYERVSLARGERKVA